MNNKPYPTCQHIMPAGRLCECPAIAGIRLCINHSRDHQRLRNLAKAREVKNYSNPKHPQYRPMDDLNAEIFESLKFPALEDPAAIAITLGNTGRLLGGRHISVREAECLGNLCRIAEINLRKGHAFFRTDMQPGLTDNDPVKPFGDAEGFVLPEEGPIHASHQELKRDLGADRANRVRTELGYNDHMLEPLADSANATPVASTPGAPASSTPAVPAPIASAEKKPVTSSDGSTGLHLGSTGGSAGLQASEQTVSGNGLQPRQETPQGFHAPVKKALWMTRSEG